jgi:two-component system, chemotaxis family, protein-glutamate methylesterase/glutaminase
MAKDDIDKYQVVAIGGSAGSLDIILKIVSLIPSDTAAAIIIVVHRKNYSDSILPQLVSTRTDLNVVEVEDKQPLLPGCFYIAPPDYHLLLEDRNTFSLDGSEKVHYSRPSIDVTFESVAETFGPAAIGVLLSGANADGAEGLQKIKEAGGFTIAQDPDTAQIGFMPMQAIKLGTVDAVLEATAIGQLISRLLTGAPTGLNKG